MSLREFTVTFPLECPRCGTAVWKPEIMWPKGKRCLRCGAENMTHETVSMFGKRGQFSTKGFIFDVYICKECNHTELYYKPSKPRKKPKILSRQP